MQEKLSPLFLDGAGNVREQCLEVLFDELYFAANLQDKETLAYVNQALRLYTRTLDVEAPAPSDDVIFNAAHALEWACAIDCVSVWKLDDVDKAIDPGADNPGVSYGAKFGSLTEGEYVYAKTLSLAVVLAVVQACREWLRQVDNPPPDRARMH